MVKKNLIIYNIVWIIRLFQKNFWRGKMFVEAFILGVIIGRIRKGRFSNFVDLHIKGWGFVVLGALIQFLPIFLKKLGILEEYYLFFPVVAAGIMLIVLFLNVDVKGIWLILLGGISNFAVILMNGLKMPVNLEAFKYAGLNGIVETILDGSVINYISYENAYGFSKFFGKIIGIPEIYPFAKVLSFGDILITIGIVWFVQGEMTNNYFRRHSRIVRYSYKS